MTKRLLRILCLGDSLTSGWCNGGLALHPYSRKLEEKLKTAFPHVKFDIVTNGLPGDVVTFERFETRLKAECVNSTFDWVIILGGTNDLAYNISAANIYRSLEKLWNIALSRGSKVLALTIPEGRARPDSVVRRRDEINLKIMTHQAPNYYFYDLESQIPYHSLSEADRARYWEDGLHLRSDGYDWMGAHIADGLIGILKREKELEPSTSTRRVAKQASEESIFFDEEVGNPKNINEGYIVVRKRDLD